VHQRERERRRNTLKSRTNIRVTGRHKNRDDGEGTKIQTHDAKRLKDEGLKRTKDGGKPETNRVETKNLEGRDYRPKAKGSKTKRRDIQKARD